MKKLSILVVFLLLAIFGFTDEQVIESFGAWNIVKIGPHYAMSVQGEEKSTKVYAIPGSNSTSGLFTMVDFNVRIGKPGETRQLFVKTPYSQTSDTGFIDGTAEGIYFDGQTAISMISVLGAVKEGDIVTFIVEDSRGIQQVVRCEGTSESDFNSAMEALVGKYVR